MSPDKQRIAAANLVGFTEMGFTEIRRAEDTSGFPYTGQLTGRDPKTKFLEVLPHFENDLNAVHELEKLLDIDQRDLYALKLLSVVAVWKKPGFDWGDICDADFFKVRHATAAQCLECILKTLNLWEEE